jgi:hypothetical protein
MWGGHHTIASSKITNNNNPETIVRDKLTQMVTDKKSMSMIFALFKPGKLVMK